MESRGERNGHRLDQAREVDEEERVAVAGQQPRSVVVRRPVVGEEVFDAPGRIGLRGQGQGKLPPAPPRGIASRRPGLVRQSGEDAPFVDGQPRPT